MRIESGAAIVGVVFAGCFPGPLPVDADGTVADVDEDTEAEVVADVASDAGVDAPEIDAADGDSGPDDGDGDGGGEVDASCSDDCTVFDTACTRGICRAGRCEVDKLSVGTCSDGFACTLDDHCDDGACVGTAKVCDDGVACTSQVCAEPSGNCATDSSACACDRDEDCIDADKCDGDERCVDHACVEGTAIDCPLVSATGNVCVVPACVPATGQCEDVALTGAAAAAVTCDDGKVCTVADHCAAGACTGSDKVCADDLSCSVDTCSEDAGGCVSDASACECQEDGDCADGNLCDGVETCVDGHCAEGTVVTCQQPADACRERVCQPALGTCKLQAKASTETCDDDDACTLDDHCGAGAAAGTCVSDSSVSCLAIDDCHSDGACNPLSGACSTPVRGDGSECADASAWGESALLGTCKVGVCEALPRVSTGQTHTCALFSDGGFTCWGIGIGGQLGYGNNVTFGADLVHPVAAAGRVPAPLATAVYALPGATCSVHADGLRCWGTNDSCMGYPSCAYTGNTPETIPNLLDTVPLGTHADGTEVRVVGMAGQHDRACIVTDRGTVRCFGTDDDWGHTIGYPGQLRVNMPGSATLATLGDVNVLASGEGWHAASVVTGNATCVRFAEGGVRCWGEGELLGTSSTGDGVIGDDEPPSVGTLAIPTTVRLTDICSNGESMCALTSDGVTMCWGLNGDGQLGVSSTTPSQTPKQAYGPFHGLELTAAIACGWNSVCALSFNGNIKCWGANDNGQLGIGSTQPYGQSPAFDASSSPTIALPTRAVAISGGAHHFCATLVDGTVRCWGQNDLAALGIDSLEDYGDEPDELVPQPVRFE